MKSVAKVKEITRTASRRQDTVNVGVRVSENLLNDTSAARTTEAKEATHGRLEANRQKLIAACIRIGSTITGKAGSAGERIV